MGSENVTGGDNQQETARWYSLAGSSETARQASLGRAMKIQSDLYGDIQSQAEMTWPPAGE
jgi:hypothetical protein